MEEGRCMKPSPAQQSTQASTLWLDQTDWEEQVDRKESKGIITAQEAGLLRHFAEHGYVITSPGLDSTELAEDIERLWAEQPEDVACAGSRDTQLKRMSHANASETRGPGCRIHDPHSHSTAARNLYLHPSLHRIVSIILDNKPVSINSILFEYGSAQQLHRDPQYVQVPRPGQLVAAWIALEDIHPDSGPLQYVPGSHRPGSDELAPVSFTPEKNQVLFWHANLRHGGSAIIDPSRTRKSYVIHYSVFANHRYVARTIAEPDRLRIVGTHRLMKQSGAVGFGNPLSRRGTNWPLTIRHRLATLVRR